MLDLSQFDGVTPGPWVEEEERGRFLIGPPESDCTARVAVIVATMSVPYGQVGAANVAAIRAVPDLIAEVKRLRGLH